MNVNVILPFALALPLFLFAYRYFSRYLRNVLSGGREEPAPAVVLRDDVDYVPTKSAVVFSHHFASIAGAGPIVGPTVALIYGYLPVWLWVVLGTIFIGAVQDFSALFISMRERGQSIARVAEMTLGRAGFILVMSFSVIMLVLVTSAFLGLSATALTSMVPIEHLRVPEGGSLVLKVVKGADGVQRAKVGGVASTSLIIITLCAPLIGWLIAKRRASLSWVLPLALLVCAGSVLVGIRFPLALAPLVWMLVLSVYVVLASGLPVWLILQPRDFINSFLLYAGMLMLAVGVVAAAVAGVNMNMPALNLAEGGRAGGMIWPFLFITVACGAVSGFHAMVSGGTTSKQVTSEKAALRIGYGGMIVEALLALLVIAAVGTGMGMNEYKGIVYPAAGASNPVLAFALSMGVLMQRGLGLPMEYGTVFGMLMVEGFIVTTLDTAVRLNRYLFEELWVALIPKPPRWLVNPHFNAILSAALMFFLCFTNSFSYIWPIFGSANQLMAALALLVAAIWLMARAKPSWFALLPAIFMLATTVVSLLILLITKYIPQQKYPLVAADLLLMGLSVGVIVIAGRQARLLTLKALGNDAQSLLGNCLLFFLKGGRKP